MSQDSVMKLLRKSKEPLTTDEISRKLKISRSACQNNINRLKEQREVVIQMLDNSENQHSNCFRLKIEGFKANE